MRTRMQPHTEPEREEAARRPAPPVAQILQLQASAGNRAVARALSDRTLQRWEWPWDEDRRQERTDERRDERTRREDGRDELLRREDGGDGSNSDFDHDWAGRAILERYLLGEGDWDIVDEPSWSEYMKASQVLSVQLVDQLQQLIAIECSNGIEGDFAIDHTFAAEIENGEGIVGYQYLHGTNSVAGGFELHVTGTITPGEGTRSVSANVGYTWNDLIDPNPQYSTDITKSAFAELITLGMAESYRISITWNEPLSAQVDEAGDVALSGYPSN